jgi:hypothetical protein
MARTRKMPERIPDDLQLLNAQQVAAALAISADAVHDLWDSRELGYVTVTRSRTRSIRCSSVAELRAFQSRRRTPAKDAA